jgi:hypothetical protein
MARQIHSLTGGRGRIWKGFYGVTQHYLTQAQLMARRANSDGPE